jgi:NAD(P)H-hydrate repair Nnr-like enzyme with NAD(P)H-hydrate dehydratase domain
MAKKKTQLDAMVDEIGTAWMVDRLIELIDDWHREIASGLADVDPLYSGNLFKALRDAVLTHDPAEVRRIVAEMEAFDAVLSHAREIMRETRSVVSAFPEVYGGKNGED